MTVFVCAACSYPSRLPDTCDNPACLANPHANHVAEKRNAEDKARRDMRKAENRARRDMRAALVRAALVRAGFTSDF